MFPPSSLPFAPFPSFLRPLDLPCLALGNPQGERGPHAGDGGEGQHGAGLLPLLMETA